MEGTQTKDLFGDAPAPKVNRGYAGHPGAGPDGETCGNCLHLVHWQPGSGRVFFKCGRTRWTHGEATDIRKKTPACEHWQTGAGLEGDATMWCPCPPRECWGLDKAVCRSAINPRTRTQPGEICLVCGEMKPAARPPI